MGFWSRILDFFGTKEPEEAQKAEESKELSEADWYFKGLNEIKEALTTKFNVDPIVEVSVGEEKFGTLVLKHGGVHFTVLVQAYNSKDKKVQLSIATREKSRLGRRLRYSANDMVDANSASDYVVEKVRLFSNMLKKEKANLDELKGYEVQKIEFEMDNQKT